MLVELNHCGSRMPVKRTDKVVRSIDDAMQEWFRVGRFARFRQALCAQPFGYLGQADTLRIGDPDSAFDLIGQDSVFGHQILISGQKFLVNGACDIYASIRFQFIGSK